MKKRKKKTTPEEVSATSSSSGALLRKRKHESGTLLRSLVALHEAESVDAASREIRCVVIREGLGNLRDKHYYGPEALGDIVARINEGGVRCFVNHQTDEEFRKRPENDVWDMAGYWKDAKIVEGENGARGVSATLSLDDSPAGDEILAKAEHAKKFAADFPSFSEVYAGLSINGDGAVDEREMDIDGTEMDVNYVLGIPTLPSIDGVTKPAREGRFNVREAATIRLLESISRSDNPQEVIAMKKKALQESAQRLKEAADQLAEGKLTPEAYSALVEAEQKKVAALVKPAKEAAGKGAKKADGGAVAEAEEEDGEEEEESEEAAASEDEEEAEETEDGTGDDGDEDDPAPVAAKPKDKGATTTHHIKHEERMTKREADLHKQLTAERALREAAERKVREARIARQLKEAGIEEVAGLTAAELAGLPTNVRKAMMGMARGMAESMPFGGGLRGAGRSGSNDGAAETFASLCEARR